MIAPNDSRILWLPGNDRRHWDYLDGSSGRSNPSGVRVTPDTSLRSTTVLACVRVLAESVSSLPLHLYRRLPDGGKEVAREHPLYRVLHVSPNSWQTSFEWREQQMLHLCTYGQSFSEIRAGTRGAVTELVSLHPSRMKVERIENGRLRYKYREDATNETIYTQDQIMHLRWLSDDGVNGMVPTELARDAIGLARACEIHGASYFGNGARPGVVLETDQTLPSEAATALRDNWERMHLGPSRAHRTAVLMGGLKAHELGGNNQESQFLESRRFQVEEICRLFRVPPHLVGDLTRSSFSNIEQQSIDFVQYTLLPWLRRFELAFSRDLISDDEYFAEFDTRGLLRGDAQARASYYNTLWNLGVASVNEIRSWENMNPIEGGDTRFVQLNMQTLEQAAAGGVLTGRQPQPAMDAPQPDAEDVTPDAAESDTEDDDPMSGGEPQARAEGYTAPKDAAAEAAKGLEWRREYKRGGTAVGVARARDISNGTPLSLDTIGRMVSYFARHEVDKQGQGWSPDQDGFPSAGRIAWALWGGDPGRRFAEAIWEREKDKRSKSPRKKSKRR